MKNFQKERISPQVATSTSNFKRCLNTLETSFADEKKKRLKSRYRFPFSYEEFMKMLAQSADSIVVKRGGILPFVIDDDNRDVVETLYKYITLDSSFNGSLSKGVMLVGKYGCGKTLLLEALANVYNSVIHTFYIPFPQMRFYKSTDLQNQVQEKGVKIFSKLPIVIDELGREPKQVLDYGNQRSPITELLCERYDNGAWTHATSNFALETLCGENQYGKMTGDRLKSMFNIIELNGGSRRK